MTSFSTYASRFLATGASAAPLTQHPSANTSHSIYQPFESPEQGSRYGLQDDGEGDEEDQLGASRRSVHRQLPHLHSQRGGTGGLSGSSRILAHLTGQGGARAGGAGRQGMRSIRDIDDEAGYEEDEQDGGVHRDHRSRISISGVGDSSVLDEERTPGASVIARDEYDPFLAEDELNRDSTHSTSNSPARHVRGASAEARARGWLAHGADSSSAASNASSIPATSRRSKRQTLPNDIYRDPDENSTAEDEDVRNPRSVRKASRSRVSQGKAPARYSVDEDDSDSTSRMSSSEDDSEDDRDAAPRRKWRAGRRTSRSDRRTPAVAAGGSSLREPLLSSAGSETLARPPGAYQGSTTQLASADIYAYPHPPVKTGWTPWAPGNRVPLSQYKDKAALLAWLGLSAVTLVIAGWMAISAHTVAPPSSPSTRPSPYYTLTRSVPALFLLTFFSLAAATANLVLLRNISRVGGAKMLRYGLIGIPVVLGVGWMWAFAGSFLYEDERWSGGGWSTTGLRLLSILPLALAVYFARSVWKRRDTIGRSLSVLELSATVVAKHPALLLLSLASLLFFMAITVPFLAIFARLFLRGHFGGPGSPSNVWHTDTNARLTAWLTLGAWIWSWLVLRGVQRVTVAGVVSHWYFHRQDDDGGTNDVGDKVFDAHEEDDSLPGPAPGEWLGEEQAALGPPTHVDIVRASFIRATGPALGTICMSALMLSLARVGTTVAASARWAHRKLSASSRVPTILHPLTHLVALLAGVSALLQGMSDYALIYVGVTGDGFAAAARRSARLTTRHRVKTVIEGLLINMLLDLTTLALCFLTGLAGFLISAHNLHVPADAPLVGLLCALIPYGTLRLCADVLSNAADTLYLCFSIDEASGEEHCKEASEAFLSTDESLPF